MHATLTMRNGDKVRTQTSRRYVVIRQHLRPYIVYRTDVRSRALDRAQWNDEIFDTVTKERVR